MTNIRKIIIFIFSLVVLHIGCNSIHKNNPDASNIYSQLPEHERMALVPDDFAKALEGENIITPFRSFFSEDLKNRICNYDAVIISDYGKGFLSESDIRKICKLNKHTFIDTKKVLKEPLGKYCSEAFMVKINSPEFEAHKSKVDLTQ